MQPPSHEEKNSAAQELGLSVQIVRKSFVDGSVILRDVRLEFAAGGFTSILGRSGVGKTTLLRIIAGLDVDYEGTVRLGGKTISGPLREAGIVFQDSRLFPWMTVAQNIGYGLPANLERSAREELILETIRSLDLAGAEGKLPSELSGGMQRRTALGRALARSPKILILDEPFSALDLALKHEMQDLIRNFHSDRNLTTLLVTHDLEEATFLSDQVLILDDPKNGSNDWIVLRSGADRSRNSEQFAHDFMRVNEKVTACFTA